VKAKIDAEKNCEGIGFFYLSNWIQRHFLRWSKIKNLRMLLGVFQKKDYKLMNGYIMMTNYTFFIGSGATPEKPAVEFGQFNIFIKGKQITH